MTSVRRKPVVLIVRDGWGENPYPEWDHANAIRLAKTPVADALMKKYPHTLIHTSGEDVGLPAGVMGNSEVGHQNIGAGRIVDQEVMRITRSIRDESFFANEVLREAIEHVKASGGTLHLLGLMSDGRVHSDIEHAKAIVELVKRAGLGRDQLAIHAITDGRDTSPTSGIEFHSGYGSDDLAAWCWPNCDGHWTFLRHGPRFAMGASRSGVQNVDEGYGC